MLMPGEGCQSGAHSGLSLCLHHEVFGVPLRNQVSACCFERRIRQGCLPEQASTLPEDDLAKPSREGCWLLQLGKMKKGLDDGILNQVLSQMMVPDISICDGVSHPLETLHQSSVGFTVACLCCLDKLR